MEPVSDDELPQHDRQRVDIALPGRGTADLFGGRVCEFALEQSLAGDAARVAASAIDAASTVLRLNPFISPSPERQHVYFLQLSRICLVNSASAALVCAAFFALSAPASQRANTLRTSVSEATCLR